MIIITKPHNLAEPMWVKVRLHIRNTVSAAYISLQKQIGPYFNRLVIDKMKGQWLLEKSILLCICLREEAGH